ncbi:hypothetical protein SK128_027761 [Halocaridina rubra]|uniref:Uncharacterized protein n=1 Tax=Halocaridina rubra TaxID=373956 RepID=A0AAN8XJY8_HALRR
MNSACNPIIYALRSPSFRRGFSEIIYGNAQRGFSDEFEVYRTPQHDFFELKSYHPRNVEYPLYEGNVISPISVSNIEGTAEMAKYDPVINETEDAQLKVT